MWNKSVVSREPALTPDIYLNRFPVQVPGDRKCWNWEVVYPAPVYREQM